MRLVVVGVALLLVTTPAAAQSRWTLSAGPEWSSFSSDQFFGGRARAEYDVIRPNRPLRLRVELGGYWEPTHNFYSEPTDSTEFLGSSQTADISFGVTASLTPLPRARFAPYVTIGVLARQSWANGWSSYTVRFVSNTQRSLGSTSGEMIVPVGLGVRGRFGGRMFQVEMRRFQGSKNGHTALMVGTSLPF
jgi:hypothetical protein